MNEFFDILKIKDCIRDLLKESKNKNEDERLILKSQINSLLNYPSNVLEYLFRYYYEINSDTKHYLYEQGCKNWFIKIFGIREQDYDTTKKLFTFIKTNIPVRGKGYINKLIAPNGNMYDVGEFSTPTLSEIRKIAINILLIKPSEYNVYMPKEEPLIVIEDLIVEDILTNHIEFPDATIQAASQFNALEFVGPDVTPKDGITNYKNDPTQGPACALACAAGTFVRNYFYQTPEEQINYLDEFEKAIKNKENKYFEIKNGYLMLIGTTQKQKKQKLANLNKYLTELCKPENIDEYNKLKNLIKIGLHQNVEIIFKNRFELVDKKGKTINQVYAAALPIAYNNIGDDPNWQNFATLILEAQYEATLLSAIKNVNNDVILTFVGGGAFGNKKEWIFNAIVTAIKEVKKIRNKNFQIKLNIKIGQFRNKDSIINKNELDLALKN